MLVLAAQGDVFLIHGAAQGAALCLQHYLRLPTLLVLEIYSVVAILGAGGAPNHYPLHLITNSLLRLGCVVLNNSIISKKQ